MWPASHCFFLCSHSLIFSLYYHLLFTFSFSFSLLNSVSVSPLLRSLPKLSFSWSSAVKEELRLSSLVFLSAGDSVLPLNNRVPFFLSVWLANAVCVCVFSVCVCPHTLEPDTLKHREKQRAVCDRVHFIQRVVFDSRHIATLLSGLSLSLLPL